MPEYRSDGQPCKPTYWDKDFKGELCPKCHDTDYEMTTIGCIHNRIICSCGWRGCECELLEPTAPVPRAVEVTPTGEWLDPPRVYEGNE
jgi:hypothetical protein